MDLELGPAGLPSGARTRGASLSLERARPIPPRASTDRVSRDLHGLDSAWHPEDGVTPERIRCAFREAERGYPEMQVKLIRGLIEGDPHTRSLFDKRNAATASKPTVFLPGDPSENAVRGARVFEIALKRLDLRKTLGHLMQCVPYGYAGLEIEWGVMRADGRLWVVPVDLIRVDLDLFRIGANGMTNADGSAARLDELRVFTNRARVAGDELAPGKWITLRYGNEALARAGQGRTAAPYLMGKRYGFRDWLILSERFGIPMPIAKYKESVEEWAKEVCAKIIKHFGSDGGAIVPEGIEIELTKGVDVDKALQAPLINFCNSELSKLVNGSTDATDGSEGGSYARANIHGEVRFESVRDDASTLHAAVDLMLATPFAFYNDVVAPPLMRQQIARDFSPQVLVKLATDMKNELGIDVSKQQMYEETGVRPPIDDNDKAPGAPKPPNPSGAAAPSKEAA